MLLILILLDELLEEIFSHTTHPPVDCGGQSLSEVTTQVVDLGLILAIETVPRSAEVTQNLLGHFAAASFEHCLELIKFVDNLIAAAALPFEALHKHIQHSVAEFIGIQLGRTNKALCGVKQRKGSFAVADLHVPIKGFGDVVDFVYEVDVSHKVYLLSHGKVHLSRMVAFVASFGLFAPNPRASDYYFNTFLGNVNNMAGRPLCILLLKQASLANLNYLHYIIIQVDLVNLDNLVNLDTLANLDNSDILDITNDPGNLVNLVN